MRSPWLQPPGVRFPESAARVTNQEQVAQLAGTAKAFIGITNEKDKKTGNPAEISVLPASAPGRGIWRPKLSGHGGMYASSGGHRVAGPDFPDSVAGNKGRVPDAVVLTQAFQHHGLFAVNLVERFTPCRYDDLVAKTGIFKHTPSRPAARAWSKIFFHSADFMPFHLTLLPGTLFLQRTSFNTPLGNLFQEKKCGFPQNFPKKTRAPCRALCPRFSDCWQASRMDNFKDTMLSRHFSPARRKNLSRARFPEYPANLPFPRARGERKPGPRLPPSRRLPRRRETAPDTMTAQAQGG